MLKRMAPFGVMLAVGAGSASAQITISVPNTVDEGRSSSGYLAVKYSQAVGGPATGNIIQVQITAAPGNSDAVSDVGRVDGLTAAEGNDYQIGSLAAGGLTPNPGPAVRTGTLRLPFILHTVSDFDAEDEEVRLTFALGGVTDLRSLTGQDGQPLAPPADPIFIRIEDDEEQEFEWDPADAGTSAQEGTAVTRTLKIDPAPDDMTWNLALSVDESGHDLGHAPSPGVTTLASSATEREISITSPDSDGNREDDTVALNVFVGGTNDLLPGLDPFEITFEDVHALPEADRITAQAYEDREGDATGITTTETDAVTEGGDPVHVRVTIDRGSKGYPMGEKLVVTPRVASAAQAADVRIEPASIEIPTGRNKRSADFLLYAQADDDVGAETLELELVTKGEKPANGPGEVVGTFSIDIVDATRALVAAQAQEAAEAAVMAALGDGPLNPGDSFTLDTTRLFNWTPAAVDVAFAASVSGAAASASVSGETVTVRAEAAGDATVTVTATATPKASSAVGTSQTLANSASVTFDVQVVLADLAIVLSGPADMNVVEGGQPAVVTAKANRAVTKDTTVRLVATGGDAAPGDYAVEDVTIEAGADEGATMLTATPDAEGERSETLTLQGVFVDDESGKDGETNALTFTLWDAAVPALPVVAQLLLAAFLAVGGYRRHRRRR